MEEGQKTEETNKKVDESNQFLIDMAQSVKQEFATESHKKRVKGLRGRKKLMVEALIAKFGIVTDACRTVGIDRKTHYRWLQEDKRYNEACKESDLVLRDLGEKALIGLIAEKNPQAVLHFNKTKNRDRGYGEHIITEEVGKKDNKMIIEIIGSEKLVNEK